MWINSRCWFARVEEKGFSCPEENVLQTGNYWNDRQVLSFLISFFSFSFALVIRHDVALINDTVSYIFVLKILCPLYQLRYNALCVLSRLVLYKLYANSDQTTRPILCSYIFIYLRWCRIYFRNILLKIYRSDVFFNCQTFYSSWISIICDYFVNCNLKGIKIRIIKGRFKITHIHPALYTQCERN